MKRRYIKPEFETTLIETAGMLAISGEQAGHGDQLAPPMMNMPEEDIPTEYED